MRKIKFSPIISKIVKSQYVRLQSAKLFLTIAIFILIPSIVDLRLSYSQPRLSQETVIELPVPSVPPHIEEPLQNVKSIPVEQKTEEIIKPNDGKSEPVKVDSKELDSLCDGVSGKWELVPNPEVNGQYIICNSDEGKMATVDELNNAQNNYRVNHGLNALSINPQLCTIAAERAREVADNFSHDGFEAAVDRHNLQKSAVGENIASGPLSAVQFVEWSWDRSPGHKANMLGNWTEGCAGVYDRFAVFIFAR